MNNISIYIEKLHPTDNEDYCQPENFCLSVYDTIDEIESIKLTFYSYKDYLDFLKNPNITLDNIDGFDLVTRASLIMSVLDYVNNHQDEFLSTIANTYIRISIEKEKDIEYDLLKSNHLVLVDISSLNLKTKIAFLKNTQFGENIRFIDKYTYGEAASYKDLLAAYSEMNSIYEEIKNSNFSVAESLYYIHKRLKQREYIKADDNENTAVSRSLVEVIKRKEIVCSGFTNMFLAICDLLEIPAEEVLWSPISGNIGHSSVIVYLYDPKYDIRGIFGIDTTWDANNGKNEKYKNNISHFLMPFTVDRDEKKLKNLVEPAIMTWDAIKNSYERLKRISKIYAPDSVIEREYTILFDRINTIYKYLGLSQIPISENVDEILNNIYSYERKAISPSKIRQIIISVEQDKADEEIESILKTNPNYKIKEKYDENVMQLLRVLNIQL